MIHQFLVAPKAQTNKLQRLLGRLLLYCRTHLLELASTQNLHKKTPGRSDVFSEFLNFIVAPVGGSSKLQVSLQL
jgi:hypothetical protein